MTRPEEGFYEMILTCPSCGTQYVVKDGAIPPGGRQVRCASCKHSWHQNPDGEESASVATGETAALEQPMPIEADAPEAADRAYQGESPVSEYDERASDDADTATAETDDADDGAGAGADESLAEATLIEPRGGPEAEQRAYEEAIIASEAVEPEDTERDAQPGDAEVPAEMVVPPDSETDDGVADHPAFRASALDDAAVVDVADDEFSPFADRDSLEPRRRSPVLTIAILVLVIAAIAAAFWFLAPAEWRARAGIGDGGKTPLELMITHPDRQKLASGQESLTIAGRVINPTGTTHAIPPIFAQLKNRAGQTIYSWTIDPPAPSLGPRASTPFNSTQVDVPPGGDDLTITLGAPKP